MVEKPGGVEPQGGARPAAGGAAVLPARAAGRPLALGLPRFGWLLLNALQLVFTLLWSAFWISLALLVRGVTRGTSLPLAMARRIWAPGLLTFAGARLEVEGLERIDFARPYFFVVNHQSQIDIAVIFRVLPAKLHFVVKEEMRAVPFLGWYVSAMEMIWVNRKERLRSVEGVRKASELLARGDCVVSFPEGTRSRDGRIRPFKTGVLVPAIEAGVPIVPVAIEGAARVLPAGGFRVRPGTIRVAIGQPIPTAGRGVGERRLLGEEARGRVEDLFTALVERRARPVRT